MLGSNTFRFHRFNEEEKKPSSRYNTFSKDFYNSNTNTVSTFINSGSNRNRQLSQNFRNIPNSMSYQFKQRNANILNLTSRQTKNNFFTNDLLYSESNSEGISSNYPLKKKQNIDFESALRKGDTSEIDNLSSLRNNNPQLIQKNFKIIENIDFESNLIKGDFSQIEKILPQMIFQDLSFTKNNHFQLVVNNFQDILQFLFSEQQKLLNNKQKIIELHNNDNSSLNKRIKQLEKEDFRTSELLKDNKLRIQKLTKKIKTYKNILTSTGNEKFIPNKILTNVRSKDGLYHCEICPEKVFKSYEQIHTHYIIEHFHTFNNKNILYNTNNINKTYFDNQLNTFKVELKNELINLNKEYDENYTNKKITDIRNETNLNNFNRTSNKTYSSNNLKTFPNLNSSSEINSYLNRLEYEQKLQYERMNDNFNKLKMDIFNEIKNIALNQQPIISNNETKINIKNSKVIENTYTNIGPNEQNDKNKYRSKENPYGINSNNNIINNNDTNVRNGSEIINNNNNNDINNDINININIKEEKDDPKINKYNNGIETIKEESIKNESTINNITNDGNKKYSYNSRNTPGKSVIKSSLQISNNENNVLDEKENENDKINNNKKIKSNIFKQSIIQNPDKNRLKEIFDEREENILFNPDIKLKNDLEYKIIGDGENKEIINQKEANILDQKEKKYFKNKNNLNKDDYKKIIYNIIKDNNNEGKNSPSFLKYYYNIVEKNNLGLILKNIEDEYKQKEIEEQEELKKIKQVEQESMDEKNRKINQVNFRGSTSVLNYDDILNKRSSIKFGRNTVEKSSKKNEDFSSKNEINELLDVKKEDIYEDI